MAAAGAPCLVPRFCFLALWPLDVRARFRVKHQQSSVRPDGISKRHTACCILIHRHRIRDPWRTRDQRVVEQQGTDLFLSADAVQHAAGGKPLDQASHLLRNHIRSPLAAPRGPSQVLVILLNSQCAHAGGGG